jgi:hypothetical protein
MTKRRSIFRSSILVLVAPLVGLPVTSALAGEPTTADEARAAAERSQARADHYDALGGVGYKTGLVQRSEAEARRYSALADELATPTPARVPTLAEQRVDRQLELARSLGGIGYKTGLVQEVVTEQQQVKPVPAADQPNPSCLPTKPAVICPE